MHLCSSSKTAGLKIAQPVLSHFKIEMLSTMLKHPLSLMFFSVLLLGDPVDEPNKSLLFLSQD
jgi:hypothetical protein